MRVTESSITNKVLNNLQNNINRMGDIQNRLSGGKQLAAVGLALRDDVGAVPAQ
nr:hypothetical protein GCM10020093_118020 [Planobispora longispora]BFE89440.1 hypothetical protein GCM10020093_120420 [Planobispora longispora]